jgi:hypothetical protein
MMLPLPLKPPRYSMGDSLQFLEIEANSGPVRTDREVTRQSSRSMSGYQ